MSAQQALAAKTAITAVTLTGTALSLAPRGRDAKQVLNWVAPGSSMLADKSVDFSYRPPANGRKTVKSVLRVFCPKVYTDTTTSLVMKQGDNLASVDFQFEANASAAEKQEVVDILLSALADAEFRKAITQGDVMF